MLRVPDALAEGAFICKEIDEPCQHLLRALAQTLSVAIDPIADATGQQIAPVQARRVLEGSALSSQAAGGGSLEFHHVDHCGVGPPRQCACPRFDEGVQHGPFVSQVMHLAAKIGQRLRIVRFVPERPANTLTRDRRVACVEHQEGNDLLLSNARRTDDGSTVDQKAEASEQLDTHIGRPGHDVRLHAIRTSRMTTAARVVNSANGPDQ